MAEHAPVVRFGRLESRGILLGLSMPQLVLVGIGVLLLVVALYVGGMGATVMSAPLWAGPILVALVPWRGRPIIAWFPLLGGWVSRRASGSTTQRASVTERPRAVVPGIRRVRLSQSASRVGVVHDATDSTTTTVLRIDGSSLLTDGASAQRALVDGWGSVLASLAQTSGLIRLQVLHRSVPGGARPIQDWWAERATAGPWAEQVADLLSSSMAGTLQPQTLLVARWRSPGLGRQTSDASADAVGRQVDALLEISARQGFAPMGAPAEAISRRSYGALSTRTQRLREATRRQRVRRRSQAWHWRSRGTTSAPTLAVHAVYWVREWPRSEAHVSFLHPVVNGGAKRTLSLTIEPVPLGRAMRDIRRAKVDHAADEARNTRTGRVSVESERAESDDVVRRERELAAGHAELRFVGLLTVSTNDLDELAASCAATETAAAQAMCEIRRLAGQQASAWLAGALPLARRVS